MADIKDIAGLSKPLTRLIEVVADGIGGVSRPLLTRRNASAKAYEIKTIAEAIAESQKLLGTVGYSAGEISIQSNQGREAARLPEATLDKRVVSRMAYQEAKKQSNLESIVRCAADDLEGNEDLGPDRPDGNWTSRFFRIAEDITTEYMQVLWGKVLAGETRQPGSFSLRTLDVLKNVSQGEAEAFVRVAEIALHCGRDAFILDPDGGKFLKDRLGITFPDLLLLREIGLMVEPNLAFSLLKIDQALQTVFSCGSTCIVVKRPAGSPEIEIQQVLIFSEVGTQLLQLVDRKPADPDYIAQLVALLQGDEVAIKTGKIASWHGTTFKVTDLVDVPSA